MQSVRPVVVDNNCEDAKVIESWTLKSLQVELSESPDEIVPNLISKNLTMFQGDAGSGKSIIASDLATAYSTGTKFLGKFPVNVNQNRPNVCYVDQDNFSQEALVSRLTAFGCNADGIVIPKDYWLRLDDMSSVMDLVNFLNDHRVGLLILDSIGSFHKLRDGKLEFLRDAFKAIIGAGTPIVILSHILKSSSATDKKAAQGTGLVQATDYTFGCVEVEFGKFKISPVKIRQGKGVIAKPFIVQYSGETRPVEVVDPSLTDKILEYLSEVGEMGTTISALRKAIGGDHHATSELVKTVPEIYVDGKRGPGSHIWHVHHKPKSVPDKVVSTDKDSGSFGEPDDASNQRTCLLELDDGDDDNDDGHESPNAGKTSYIELDDDVSTYGSPA
jgi:hypothetical protein